jgi:hypothetical protein
MSISRIIISLIGRPFTMWLDGRSVCEVMCIYINTVDLPNSNNANSLPAEEHQMVLLSAPFRHDGTKRHTNA